MGNFLKMGHFLENGLFFENCFFLKVFGFFENRSFLWKLLFFWKWVVFLKIGCFFENVSFFWKCVFFLKMCHFFENCVFLKMGRFLKVRHFDHFGLFGTIWDHFGPFWTILNNFDQFWPSLTFYFFKFLIHNFFRSFWHQRIYDTTLGSWDIAFCDVVVAGVVVVVGIGDSRSWIRGIKKNDERQIAKQIHSLTKSSISHIKYWPRQTYELWQ